MLVRSLGLEDALEKEIATHSSILDWKIPWTKELSRLQSMRLQRVRHNLVTKQQHKMNQTELSPCLHALDSKCESKVGNLHNKIVQRKMINYEFCEHRIQIR